MNTIKLSKIKIFYVILFFLASLSSSHSYSVSYDYSISWSGSEVKIVKNGVEKVYRGWGARVRSIPIMVGTGFLLGTTVFGLGAVVVAAGFSITAIPAAIFYGGYWGLSSVFRAARNMQIPPTGANCELAEPSGVNVNLSIVIPVTATSLINEDYLSPFIDDLPNEEAFINRQELAGKIINFSGVSSLADSTLNQFHRKAASGQVRNYLVVLLVEKSEAEQTKPRELSKHDADFIVSNRTFLHHESETNLINYEDDITSFLFDNIKHYSIDVTRKQLEGCVLYFMINDDMARITVVPFS